MRKRGLYVAETDILLALWGSQGVMYDLNGSMIWDCCIKNADRQSALYCVEQPNPYTWPFMIE
jgi:hypothetical protein